MQDITHRLQSVANVTTGTMLDDVPQVVVNRPKHADCVRAAKVLPQLVPFLWQVKLYCCSHGSPIVCKKVRFAMLFAYGCASHVRSARSVNFTPSQCIFGASFPGGKFSLSDWSLSCTT